MQRRLVAILAADVVGYSRLMGENEEATLAALREMRRDMFEPLVGKHAGAVIKSMGDGWLVEYGSVVDAVNCAIHIQDKLSGHDIIKLRIGVHVGDVMHEDEDIYGDGVNIAARLQELAAPGGIVISDTVRRSVDSRLMSNFTDLGAQRLKNIIGPIGAYGWGSATIAAALERAERSAPADTKISIAVLPFKNISNDPEQEYFSDGMAEDLITDLSKVAQLSVATRNACFAFKGQMPQVSEVRDKLGVEYVLEGSIRKIGDRLRINAQLIDATDGEHRWAERYDGELSDLFEFQDRITAEIVSALKLQFSPSEKAGEKRKRTSSVEAYDLYLKGRTHYFRYSAEDNLKSRECLEHAIALDPEFAEAHSYLSCCYTNAWLFLWPGFDEGLPRGLEWAQRGVELDPGSAIAHTRLAWVHLFLREHQKAIGIFEKAVALHPDNAEVRAYYAETLNFSGDPEAAMEHLKIALSLDPFFPPSWLFMLGHANFLLNEFDEAERLIEQALERIPGLQVARQVLICLYMETGRPKKAADQLQNMLQAMPLYTLSEVDRIYPYLQDAVLQRFIDDLRAAGLPED